MQHVHDNLKTAGLNGGLKEGLQKKNEGHLWSALGFGQELTILIHKKAKNIAGETKINQRDLQKPDAQNSEGMLSGAMYANDLITYICKLYYC